MSASDLDVRVDGALGRITLQRGTKLHALTHAMVRDMATALDTFETDDRVRAVLVDATGERAFCAGGDVKAIWADGVAGDAESARRFFHDEYRLNARIARYPKPYIALLDGITMGGGVGISVHGSHRVLTERSRVAMPEAAIGLVPDVGATHWLGRAPGHLGEYLAMTGASMHAADALQAGFGDTIVDAARLDDLVGTLVRSGNPNDIGSFAIDAGTSNLAEHAARIDDWFGHETVAEIVDALEQAGDDPFATDTLERLRAGSPLSLQLGFDLVRAARAEPGIERALTREYRVTARAIEHTDFIEGVRARLVDKDGAPRWRAATLADLDPETVALMGRPTPGGDLVLD